MSLYRSDALTAIIELDKHMGIARVDDAMGLMFGISAQALVKKSFSRYGAHWVPTRHTSCLCRAGATNLRIWMPFVGCVGICSTDFLHLAVLISVSQACWAT